MQLRGIQFSNIWVYSSSTYTFIGALRQLFTW